MSSNKKIAASLLLGALTSFLVVAVPVTAGAEEAEPPVSTIAWYWEQQQSVNQRDPLGNSYEIELPNPFCPGPPGSVGGPSQTCNEGRLPIEVHRGDYETPDKLSAVAFDLSLIPIGSKVSEFKVTFLEAKRGCYDPDNPDDNPQDDKCEQTDPINVADHQLEACQITEIFGDGEAREYKEIPRYTCDDRAIAKRKEVTRKNKDGTETTDHVWTFDLTAFAQGWVKEFSAATAILIRPAEPKQQPSQQEKEEDTWRVVLAGPRMDDGVRTTLSFDPPKTPPLPPTTTDPTGTETGTGSVGTTTTDTGFGATTDTGTGTTSDLPTSPSPIQSPAGVATGDEVPPIESMPWYAWLAILVGLVAFSLVRSAVIESTTGHRPQGVVAQIHSLNAERRGAAAATTAGDAGALGAVAAGFRATGEALKRVGRKIFGRGAH